MIEIRLRAAASNPGSRRWRWGISLLAMALGVVAPVATSRAQDSSRMSRVPPELESLRAMKIVTVEGGESVSITSGAASIILKKDGTVVIKGTEIILDNAAKPSARTTSPLNAPPIRHPDASEIF